MNLEQHKCFLKPCLREKGTKQYNAKNKSRNKGLSKLKTGNLNMKNSRPVSPYLGRKSKKWEAPDLKSQKSFVGMTPKGNVCKLTSSFL